MVYQFYALNLVLSSINFSLNIQRIKLALKYLNDACLNVTKLKAKNLYLIRKLNFESLFKVLLS